VSIPGHFHPIQVLAPSRAMLAARLHTPAFPLAPIPTESDAFGSFVDYSQTLGGLLGRPVLAGLEGTPEMALNIKVAGNRTASVGVPASSAPAFR